MRVSFLTVFAMSVAALAQVRSTPDMERPAAIKVRLGSEDTVSFRVSERVVTDIDLHVRGADYSVSLQCAGGLHDVNVETVELWWETSDIFSLVFDMGNEQDRKFGKLPRVQVGFSRGRLVELNVATRTSERSGFSSKLCSSLPVGSIIRKDPRSLQDLVTVATVGQTRWRLPVTIEAVQDVSTRSVETGGGQARGVLYVGRGNSFTIKKGEHFLMVKIATEGGCRIEYEKRQYNVSSCPWLDGFRDHQEDFFKVVPGQARAERVSSVGLR